MAQQPDISSLLAALAAQRTASTPSQPQQPAAPPSGIPQGYPGSLPTPTQSGTLSGYSLPHPTNSGSLDLSSIRPVSTGSVSLADAVAKARGIAAEKGVGYETGRSSAGPRDPRLSGRPYRRSRSRSRSPPRRDQFRDNNNPYRDERRNDRGGGDGFVQSRSRSPGRGRAPFSPQRTFSGRNQSPGRGGDENSEIILIDSALVGLVIGRQGENLRRVEQDSNTRIQFVTGPESSGPQRQCRISGPPRARMDAKREINRIIDENGGNPVKEVSSAKRDTGRGKDGSNHPVLREGENSIQIMVPDRTVGLIIGRGGETIRDLQERSGCHVNIVGENKSVNGLRPVNLIGSKHAADMAKDLIMEIVESDTRGGNNGGGGAAAAAAAPAPHVGGRGYDSYQSGASGFGGGDKINDKIMVPSDAVGMIIGKGGETIKDMQNQTGCKINVTQPAQPDHEREIGLIGSRQAIDSAKRAIWEKVDSVRNRDSGGYGGGGRGGRGGRDSNDHYGGGGGGGGQSQYSQPQQQPYGQQPMGQPAPPPGGQADGNAADPYAAWGGYQNYMAMWYAALAQQQKQGGQAPGAPGA